MWFLVKCAFWLSVVVLLLPIPENERHANVAYVSTGEAVSALTAALNDMRGFCTRNPEACTTGANAAQSFGHKAQAGARMLHDFISERLEDTRHLNLPPGSRATPMPQPAVMPMSNGGIDTLSPQDREPEWRGAVPQRRT
jgi:hypothetical protein